MSPVFPPRGGVGPPLAQCEAGVGAAAVAGSGSHSRAVVLQGSRCYLESVSGGPVPARNTAGAAARLLTVDCWQAGRVIAARRACEERQGARA